MKWFKYVLVLGASVAHAQPKFASTEQPLPEKCWKVAGAEYELTTGADGCQLLEASVTLEGEFTVGTDPVKPSKVLRADKTEVEIAKVTAAGGPLVLVLEDKMVAVSKVTMKGATGTPPKTGPCAWGKEHDGDIRVDFINRSVDRAPDRNVVQPNEGLKVHVCRAPTQTVTTVWGGTRGLTPAAIAGQSQSEGVTEPVIVTMTFPPRRAGAADLQFFDGTDTTKSPAMSVELEVEPLLWGSVRFGLGTLVGDWRSYEIVTMSGSRTQEVRENESGAAFELVSGFAPYVVDLLANGGRSHTGGTNYYVAPFIGFGVIGTSPDKGVEGLSSVHGGIELEFADNFSVAFTYVYRKTRRLASGYEPGSPVASGMSADSITSTDWVSGFGVVVNATPEFLQFATGSSKEGGK